MTDPDRAALHELAHRMGIVSSYHDLSGTRRVTSDETRVALLAAMGEDGSTGAAVREALDRRAREAEGRLAGPVTVLAEDASELRVGLPIGMRGRVEWTLDLITEDGDRRTSAGSGVVRAGQRSIGAMLPAGLTAGYHSVRIRLEARSSTHSGETFLILSPGSCTPVRDVIGDDRVFGVNANLYTVRSERNWGVGDLTDLADLCAWMGREGGAFAGINPLHALRNEGGHISPYSPVSRLFRNPIYLDVTAIPEWESSPPARALADSREAQRALAAVRAAGAIDYDAVWALKRPVLEALFTTFREQTAARDHRRARAFEDFTWRHGDALRDFATFQALAERFGVADWREWPGPFRDPRSSDVGAFRAAGARSIDFHAFLQFEMERQLGAAAAAGREAGMRIGLYGDLAIGSAAGGSDRWTFPALFLDGASIGAPPDDFAPHGQDWSLPPIDPGRLATERFRYWILLIRNALTHCGALRIDHVMGLFRQFWIPAGRTGEDGAYVRYPARPLLAILAIESRRRGALVIGEDLGTVPRGLPARLARHEILSTRVLYFERDPGGEFRPPSAFSRRALVTVNTHDHSPLAGWWAGREIDIRHDVGDLSEQERSRAHERRAAERDSLRRRLAAARILPRGAEVEPADLCAAVHAYLGRTRAPLLGVALDDLAGETEPVNLPGVTGERFSSWTRRMRMKLDDMPGSPAVDRALQGVEARVRGIAG